MAGSVVQLAVFALLVVLIPLSRAVPDLLFRDKDGTTNVLKFGERILRRNGNVFARNNIHAPLTENNAIPQNVLGRFRYFGRPFGAQVRVCN